MKEQLKSKFPALHKLLKRVYFDVRRLSPFISARYIYAGGGRYFDIRRSQLSKIQPNLFIIGAEKSGTTSLHHYLAQHPGIFMSHPNKEPHFLLDLKYIQRYFKQSSINIHSKNDLLKNHMLRGYRGERIFGESTTAYTRGTTDTAHKIPQRLNKLNKNAKCIYLIRHPVDRIVSSYKHRRRLGLTQKPLNEEIDSFKPYIFTSNYSRHIEAFQKTLGEDAIKVVIYEDFVAEPAKTMQLLFNFMEVDSNVEIDTSQAYNRHPASQQIEIDPKLLKSLNSRFAEEKSKLESLLGRKLPWEL